MEMCVESQCLSIKCHKPNSLLYGRKSKNRAEFCLAVHRDPQRDQKICTEGMQQALMVLFDFDC